MVYLFTKVLNFLFFEGGGAPSLILNQNSMKMGSSFMDIALVPRLGPGAVSIC